MLKISKISFPGLGIGEFEVNSVAFELPWFGGETIEIAWYAVLITIGMICAVAYTIFRSRQIGITAEDVVDFALFVIPIGVIGARLYYVFSKIENYSSFYDVINIRDGGLAIYGGIIAGGLTVLAICYIKKINFLAFADCVAPGVLVAQGIGRWGNFTNGEAFGYATDWFCRMGLQNDHTGGVLQYVHPTFLYESLWNIAGFVLAALLTKKKKHDGQIFLLIFGWYGFGRMFIEGLRTDSLYIGETGIRVSQLLGGIIFVISLCGLIYMQFTKRTKPLYHKTTKLPSHSGGETFESKKKAEIKKIDGVDENYKSNRDNKSKKNKKGK
ncbi:MAG: prolipoprotein diacylglyceryl transferase [Clostridia bacterium]|nr:prolipoprotein diacylglyceryl transferase [Clostridia bacterium]